LTWSIPRTGSASRRSTSRCSWSDAYRYACAASGAAALADVGRLLLALDDSRRRCKATHVTLATRMLGDARGSGHTFGVGYLEQWVDHRLFWGQYAKPGQAATSDGVERPIGTLVLQRLG
jgi:tryptophan 2,3-dioxygenase